MFVQGELDPSPREVVYRPDGVPYGIGSQVVPPRVEPDLVRFDCVHEFRFARLPYRWQGRQHVVGRRVERALACLPVDASGYCDVDDVSYRCPPDGASSRCCSSSRIASLYSDPAVAATPRTVSCSDGKDVLGRVHTDALQDVDEVRTRRTPRRQGRKGWGAAPAQARGWRSNSRSSRASRRAGASAPSSSRSARSRLWRCSATICSSMVPFATRR